MSVVYLNTFAFLRFVLTPSRPSSITSKIVVMFAPSPSSQTRCISQNLPRMPDVATFMADTIPSRYRFSSSPPYYQGHHSFDCCPILDCRSVSLSMTGLLPNQYHPTRNEPTSLWRTLGSYLRRKTLRHIKV